MKSPISEESAGRMMDRVTRYKFLLPSAMVAFTLVDYLGALASPTLTKPVEGDGGAMSVTVKLADPGMLDRFMATLPALAVLLAVTFAYGYIIRADLRRAKNLAGESTSPVFLVAIGVMSVIVMFVPAVADVLKAYYFGIATPDYPWGPDYMILFAAIGILVLDSLSAKGSWGEQQERADALEEKIQDVV